MGTRSLGDSRKSIARAVPPLPRDIRLDLGREPQAMKPNADARAMRVVLEWLGIVAPDRSRKEPVALPAWAPLLVPLAGAILGGLLFLCVVLLVHALAI
jgi:hypothetical protein